MSPRTIACALISVSSLARAAPADEPQRANRGHVPSTPDRALNLVISGGAGVEGFVGAAMRDAAASGAAWNVRAGIGAMSEVRVELVYAGSSQSLSGMDGTLTAHGVHALMRANFTPKRSFEGFFYVGAGWTRFRISADAAGLESPDDVLEMPLGLGVARRFGRFVVDARAGISIVAGADLVPNYDPGTSADGESMHRYGVRANLGVEL